jgi:hypothetical protein
MRPMIDGKRRERKEKKGKEKENRERKKTTMYNRSE